MDMKKAKILYEVFGSFFKIGAFTFGGGYAMIPLIQNEIVKKRGWIAEDEMPGIIAISESTPGPIAVNAATFVGYRVCGVSGAFFATLGVVVPSFAVIAAISCALRAFEDAAAVRYAFFGIRAGVLALIVGAFASMLKQCPRNAFSFTVAAAAFALVALAGVSPIYVIAGSAAAGLAAALLSSRRACHALS